RMLKQARWASARNFSSSLENAKGGRLVWGGEEMTREEIGGCGGLGEAGGWWGCSQAGAARDAMAARARVDRGRPGITEVPLGAENVTAFSLSDGHLRLNSGPGTMLGMAKAGTRKRGAATDTRGSVSIHDVAQAAKVSIATVSRVMNNPELVAPKTAA